MVLENLTAVLCPLCCWTNYWVEDGTCHIENREGSHKPAHLSSLVSLCYLHTHFEENRKYHTKNHERQHDKSNKMTVRPVKTQISQGICPVWSESSLCAQWVAKDPSFLHGDSEETEQTGRMPRLIWIRWAHMPFCRFCHEVAQNFLTLR